MTTVGADAGEPSQSGGGQSAACSMRWRRARDALGAEPAERLDGDDERAALDRVERDLRASDDPPRQLRGDLVGVASFTDDDLHTRMNETIAWLLPGSERPRSP